VTRIARSRRIVGGLATALLVGLAVPLLAQDAPQQAAAPAESKAPAAGGSAFNVTDIRVDVSAKTTEAARLAAFREAARRAWPQLWMRMTGTPEATAPKLPDSAIEGMVSGIEVQRERYSATRYIATLGVVFDRGRAGERLPASARILQSAPILLLPLLVDGGVRTIHEDNSPWRQAWARFGTDTTPIDYVRAPGSSADAVLLNGWQARRDNRALWRSILARYGAENVVVAEAHLDRSYPGGPVVGTFLARYGPDSDVLARFRLRAGAVGELDAMLDAAVRRIDGAYAMALQTGKLAADPSLTLELAPITAASPTLDAPDAVIGGSGLLVNVATPDAATLSAFETAIRATPGVDGLTLASLAIGGVSQVRIAYSVDYQQLRYALDQRGLRLDGGVLRRRAANEAPLPAPAAPAVEADAPIDLLPDEATL
jgi:hypothetical protein